MPAALAPPARGHFRLPHICPIASRWPSGLRGIRPAAHGLGRPDLEVSAMMPIPAAYPFPTPLGTLLLASDGQAITGAWFQDRPRPLRIPAIAGDNPALTLAKGWLEAYFQGRDPGPLPPLRLVGTPFQQEVWQQLLTIPYGQATTYGELAAALARQRKLPALSPRAVGSALGRNPVAILVPCHRVLGRDGSLTGYAWGLERKRALLELEGVTGLPLQGGHPTLDQGGHTAPRKRDSTPPTIE